MSCRATPLGARVLRRSRGLCSAASEQGRGEHRRREEQDRTAPGRVLHAVDEGLPGRRQELPAGRAPELLRGGHGPAQGLPYGGLGARQVGAVDGGPQTAQDGHPEGSAELLAGLQKGGGRTGLLGGGGAERHVRDQGHHGDDAAGEDPGSGQQQPQRVRAHQAGQGEPGGGEGEAARDDVGPVGLLGEGGADGGGGADEDRGGEAPEGGFQGAHAEHRLQVLGGEVGRAHHREGGDGVHADAGAEAAPPEEGPGDHGVVTGALAAHEEPPEGQAGGEAAGVQRGEALGGDLLEPVDHRQHGGRRQRHAQQVEAAGRRVRELGDQHGDQDQQEQHRGHVDQEDGAPPEVVQHHPAEHRAQGDAAGHGTGPDRDGLAALLVVLEEVAYEGERGRHQGRTADAEQDAGGDQHVGAGGVGGADGGDSEGGGAEQQQLAAADPVTERAHRDQQAGEGEGVAVEDPELLRGAGVQLPGDGRDGEVEDGDVHRDQEQGEQENGEGGPFPATGETCCGVRHEQ